MQFNFTYSASVNAAPAAFKTVVQQVGAYYASLYSDPITLNYQIGWGEANGTTLGAGTLGLAVSSNLSGYSYAQLRNAYIADSSSADDAAAVATLGANSPVGSSTIYVDRSVQKALGLISGSAAGIDGYAGFSSTYSWDYDFTNGVGAGQYDLYSVVFHELGHLLGRTLNFGASGVYFAADLFHYDANGVRSNALGGYLATNGTIAGRLGQLDSTHGLGSASDFVAGSDPYTYALGPGVHYAPTENDLRLNDILGYNRTGFGSGVRTATSDFNGDNHSDVLWRHDASGALSEWLMDGGTIASNVAISTKVPAAGFDFVLRAGDYNDFNGDGRDDIVFRNKSSGALMLWEMSGNQIVANYSLPTIDLNWRLQGTGDFNNDGKADVMWRNVSGAVSLWTMDGPTITTNVAMPTIDNTWRFQSLGDFNGDHKSDVLWRHVSGQIVFWQMDGATIKDNQPLQAQVDLSWHVMGTGDFNGDGKTDVVWRHNSGFVSLWTMDGYNIAANNAVADITNNWQIRAIGDYNGDGKSDLLWQDTGSGFVALWQMNGPSIAANVAVTTIGSDWSIAFSQGSSLDFV